MTLSSRVVMIPALDLDPELDFPLFGDISDPYVFGSSKKWNHKSQHFCAMILALDPEVWVFSHLISLF